MTRAAAAALVVVAVLAPSPAVAQSADARAVQAAAEHFLEVLGNRDLDTLPSLLAPRATIVVARLREGAWSHTAQTFEEWLAAQKAQTTATRFREPLTAVTVHVEDGQLAHLRANFTVVIDGTVRSHGVDYFTLVMDAGAWKVANISYTSMPGPPD